MAVFDQYINKVYQYIDELKKKDRPFKEKSVIGDIEHITQFLFADDASRKGSTIVLKSDTFLELGNPAVGSHAMTLYTDNPSLINDGRITLIGPDIQEASSAVLPYGQVIMAGGEKLEDQDYNPLLLSQNVSDKIQGYMVKSTPENIWSRISYGAAHKGFNFDVLGTALLRKIKDELPKVQSVEILFVTSGKDDILVLNRVGVPVREAAQKIKKKIWKDRGVDISACRPGGHCGACENKSVCDNIRKIMSERRKTPDADGYGPPGP